MTLRELVAKLDKVILEAQEYIRLTNTKISKGNERIAELEDQVGSLLAVVATQGAEDREVEG